MSYETFQSRIKALINKIGGDVNVRFSTDPEQGKHYANCSDGTIIIGNKTCLKVSIRWGSGHQAIATI